MHLDPHLEYARSMADTPRVNQADKLFISSIHVVPEDGAVRMVRGRIEETCRVAQHRIVGVKEESFVKGARGESERLGRITETRLVEECRLTGEEVAECHAVHGGESVHCFAFELRAPEVEDLNWKIAAGAP